MKESQVKPYSYSILPFIQMDYMCFNMKSFKRWEKLSVAVTANCTTPYYLISESPVTGLESAIHIEVLSRVFSRPGVEALASSSSGGGCSNFKEDFGFGVLNPTRASEFAA